MGHGNIVKRAIAFVAFAWAAGAAGQEKPAWAVCRAEAPVKDGVVHALQSAPFDAQPYYDFNERMAAQRPFEAPLRAIGATGVWEATVRCGALNYDRGKAEAAGASLRAESLAAHKAAGLRVVEKPWVPALARKSPPAPLLVGAAERATPATLASGPENWGLTRDDFARLHNEALLKKAGLPGRRAALEAAAAAGDAYAQHLLAIRPSGQEDDLRMMKQAADQGLLRAMADYHGQMAVRADGDRAVHVKAVTRLAELGSPHADFIAGVVLLRQPNLSGGDRMLAVSRLLRADKADYAPAQLWVAYDLIKSKTPEQRQKAIDVARQAAAQGLSAADEFLRKYPKP